MNISRSKDGLPLRSHQGEILGILGRDFLDQWLEDGLHLIDECVPLWPLGLKVRGLFDVRMNVADVVVLRLRHAKVPRRLANQVRAILFRLLGEQELCSAAEVFLPLLDEVKHLQPVLQLITKLPLLLETLVGLRELAAIRVGRKPPLQHVIQLRRVTTALPVHLPELIHAAPHGHDGVAHDVKKLGVLRERHRNFPRACDVGCALVQPLVAESANG
mmetsp:Transcript_58108/g.139448  ORF Transcript_58108/g.139448 Transcript_58108/m.139448 type:complete len:217 (-) Transcript_58108:647-1297(-)